MSDSLTIFGTTYNNVAGFKAAADSSTILAYIRPQGTLAISSNGTSIDVAQYSAVDVAVSGGSGVLITKTITENGTYAAASDSADGYSIVTASIPNSFTIAAASNSTGITAEITAGTGGGGGATQHEIHLEFSDSTDTDIDVYYDDSLLGTMITSYEPSTWTYSNKTVTLAQLDNVTWYDKQSIPIGVQLVNYTQVVADTAIDSNGDAESAQWFYASDYTRAESGMAFSYRASYWHYIAFYDESKTCLGAFTPYQGGGTQDPDDNNTGYGPINAQNVPAGTKYIRLCGTWYDSDHMSLIRTA